MGLETRKGREAYYYRKRRIGRHVVSQYVGTGDIAILAEVYDERDRAKKEAVLKQHRAEREKAEAADAVLDKVAEGLGALVKATLLLEGYHSHKGEWRRRRDTKSKGRG